MYRKGNSESINQHVIELSCIPQQTDTNLHPTYQIINPLPWVPSQGWLQTSLGETVIFDIKKTRAEKNVLKRPKNNLDPKKANAEVEELTSRLTAEVVVEMAEELAEEMSDLMERAEEWQLLVPSAPPRELVFRESN